MKIGRFNSSPQHKSSVLFPLFLMVLLLWSFSGAILVSATTASWEFDSSSDYTFDSSKIEVSSGRAQMKMPDDWYDQNWPLRKPITINNTSNASDLTDYQVQVSVTYNSDMQDDFDDLRFTDSDGTTLIDHWREDYTASSSATFWVEVPSISGSSTKTIYMYYGNSGADSASSGDDTFEFFDDFETGSSYELIFDLFKGKPWERYESNPILTKSASGWDSLGLRDPKLMIDTSGMLVQEGGEYIMYYSGYKYAAPHYDRAIGRATSSDGISWTRYGSNPVLEHGDGGEWDYFGTQLGNVVKRGTNDYIMFYSGVGAWDAWGVGVATSTDGVNWNKYGSNPVLMNSDFNLGGNDILTGPYALKLSNGNWVMYLYGTHSVDGFDIFGAQSTDGLTWTVLNSGNAVLAHSPGEWDDDNIETPVVMEVSNGNYVMLYHGNDNTYGGQHKLGIATSTDLVNWTKYSENPVMLPASDGEWDDWRVENMFIAKDDIGEDTIRMWYSGTPSGDGEQDSAIGYATSDQNYSGDYFSEWDEVGTVTETTVVENGNRVASLKGDDSHNGSLVNKTGTFSDFILEARVKPTVDDNNTCLPYFNFRYTNLSNRYLMILRGEVTNDLFLRRKELGADYINAGYSFNYGVQYYDFKAVFNGTEIDVYLDETHLVDYTDTGSGITSGAVGIYNFRPTNAVYFDDVRIRKYTSPEPSASAGSEALAFAADNPAIHPTASNSQTFTSLSGFSESATKNGGEIKYQISDDQGTTWYWFNSGWTETVAGYTEANTASEVNTNIGSFPGNSEFLFKAYLHSDGTQQVQLNSVTLTYVNDTASPTGSVSVAGGSSYTTSGSVTLTIAALDDIDPAGLIQMQVSNNQSFSGAGWESYATSKAWTLASGDGTKTVYVRFRDSAANTSSGYSDTIILDSTPPSGSLAINSGAAYTTSTSVTLAIAATDAPSGLSGMMVSNNYDFSGAGWESYATSKSWTLTSGDGTKAVYLKFKDLAGNISSVSSDTIVLSTPVPAAPTYTPVSTPQGPGIQGSAAEEEVGEEGEEGEGQEEPEEAPQTRTLRIRVVDENGNPIEGVKVTLYSDPKVATTDKDGIATFGGVSLGEHRVVVAYDGQTGEKTIAVEEDEETITIKLEPAEQEEPSALSLLSLVLLSLCLLIIAGLFLLLLRKRKHY